ncbi:MAG: Sec-independent protein translocase protein TatB [Qipengyuania sp.]|jgi:sec-independent protein translocase protein TatB|nr:Sec-independent protein translocase protein TatB [Qipengyuania sp.]
MFDIAPSELLLVAVVALLVIGPKDLPLALRTAGRWMGKVRRMSNHFRAGVETMIREAELAEIEKEWRERNARIMAEHPDAEALEAAVPPGADEPVMEPLDTADPPEAAAEAAIARPSSGADGGDGEPELPLSGAVKKRRA